LWRFKILHHQSVRCVIVAPRHCATSFAPRRWSHASCATSCVRIIARLPLLR
jgi:hypothetical protein